MTSNRIMHAALGLAIVFSQAVAQPAAPFVVRSYPVADVIEVTPGSRFRIVSPADLGRERAVSLRDAAGRPGAELKSTLQASSSVLLVSGGFSTGETHAPVGLLLSGGKLLSSPQYRTRPADPSATCEFLRVERYRLSGQVCSGASLGVQVGPFTESGWHNCTDALQAGPVLVQDGKVTLCTDDQLAYQRAAVCTLRADPSGAVALRVVITTRPQSLHALASWLAQPLSAGGPGCYSAVNLAGDTSAGAALWTAGARRSATTPPRTFGKGSYPMPSFIQITSGR